MAWMDAARLVLQVAAFGLIGATAIVFYVAHRRSRATVFTDVALKATLLLLAVMYLAFVESAASLFPGSPAAYALAAAAGYALVAGFFLSVAVALWRVVRRTNGAIIVSPEFLAGLRSRTRAMYGESPSRFIVYAVGKESAEKAMQRFLGEGGDPMAHWARLPRWFRALGYGKLRFLSHEPGRESRLEIVDTIESTTPDAPPGCELTRGYLAGLGSVLHPSRECECVELRCSRSEGGRACEFALHWFPRAPEATAPRPRAEVRP